MKLDDDQADAFHEMEEPTKEKFLALTSDEKDDVVEVDTETRDIYVERFSKLTRDNKKFLKTLDTKKDAVVYLMLFETQRLTYQGLEERDRKDFNNLMKRKLRMQ